MHNAAGDRGVSLEYNIRDLPCFTLWKCTQAEADGYVTGLEPGINLPNLKTFERTQGRVITLSPGASHNVRIDLAVHSTKDDVAAVQKRIIDLQNRAHPSFTTGRSPSSRPPDDALRPGGVCFRVFEHPEIDNIAQRLQIDLVQELKMIAVEEFLVADGSLPHQLDNVRGAEGADEDFQTAVLGSR